MENPKFDENRSKILQNHIVTELDDLRATFWVVPLGDVAKRIDFILLFDSNEILRARKSACNTLEYSVGPPKFDENRFKITLLAKLAI